MAEIQHSIFIGYRRDDTADASGRVFDRLYTAFGAGQVFKDVDNLPVGVDFGQHILTILPKCRVFMAMIGPGWIDVRDETGSRRLDNPNDWVRIELETALATPGLQIVPVLINGAPMPKEDMLPESLRRLVKLNAAVVRRDPDFHKDMDKLIAALRTGLMTGRVVVETADSKTLSGSAAAWKYIENSLYTADYDDFLKHFPGTPEVMLASRHRRQLEAWAVVARDDPDAIGEFLEGGLFETLERAAKTCLQTAQMKRQVALETALAKRRASEAAEAETQRKAEEASRIVREAARRHREAIERRLGPEAASAVRAARLSNPIAERLYSVQVPNVANWPDPLMAAIPPGRFLMGAAAGEPGAGDFERPQHQVDIEYPFALGVHAVTFAEWDAALDAGARLEKPGDQGWGRNRRPVINVSWEDAMAYIDWLNENLGLSDRPDEYRLPTEAEWEYACRAGTTTTFNFGETITPQQANYSSNSINYEGGPKVTWLGKTQPVGSYQPNAFGLYDMHANVWEWCADPWHDDYTGAPVDGSIWASGDTTRRVVRGGSWTTFSRQPRSANRNWCSSTFRNEVLGFRLARTL